MIENITLDTTLLIFILSMQFKQERMMAKLKNCKHKLCTNFSLTTNNHVKLE